MQSAEFARTALWLLPGARTPGEEGRCSPEYSFRCSIFIFTTKKMLQELSETVNHKYFKIIFQAHLKWTCSILKDYIKKKKGTIFSLFFLFFRVSLSRFYFAVFFFFFFFFLVTTSRPKGHLTCFKRMF